MSEHTLKDKLAKGLFWTGFSNVLQQLLNLIFGIFLARILSRADYCRGSDWEKARLWLPVRS